MATNPLLNNIEVTGVSGLNGALQRRDALIQQGGKALANSLHPDEMEYYLLALEIVDANDNNIVLDYISFPIMPDSIRISEQKIQSTTKTAAGLVVLENTSFIPKTINISGNFGKKFRTLAGNGDGFPSYFSDESVQEKLKKKSPNLKLPDFDISTKTGYGVTKILERMFNRASDTSNEVPVQMFLYCYAFNYNYLVQPLNIQFSQNKSLNMIWEYSMTFTAIAPASELRNTDKYKKSLSKYATESFIKGGVDQVLGFVKDEKNILQNIIANQVGLGTDQFALTQRVV